MATPLEPSGAVYYIRPDGGSAEQYTVLADAPCAGSGLRQPCARDHPFRHNTSDGLDLLYRTRGGTITLNRVRAEGNAGN
ncbi:MAG: hypothetical protein Fur0021_40940 [Candidatus Promineifilaceae bacterium]